MKSDINIRPKRNYIKLIKETYKENMGMIIYVLLFVGILSGITALWQIAEQIIEGAINPSIVDLFVAIILSSMITNKIYKYIEIKK